MIWHHEDGFFGEAFLHFIKGLLSSIIPNKGLVFLKEFVYGLSKLGKFPNEASIKVSKSKERAHLFNAFGDWPVTDSIEFCGVHHHLAFFDNKAKVFDLCFAKFAFQWFEVEVGFSEAFKNAFGEAFKIFFVLGKDRMSSMYTMQNPSSILSLRVSFIIAWNVEGELHNPKNMTVGSYSLRLVLNAAFH